MNDWLAALFEALEFSVQDSAPYLLFLSAFLSATILPGGSEATLLAMLHYSHHSPVLLLSVATVGNSLGGMVNYFIGLWLPNRTESNSRSQRSLSWLSQYGYWALLFSWLPVIGDLLCLASGWLKMSPLMVFVFVLIGKAARYCLMAAIFFEVF